MSESLPGRAAIAALLALVVACDRAPTTPSTDLRPATRQAAKFAPANAAVLAQLGQRMFEDRDLSLLRNQSCATCHDVAFGFSSPNTQHNGAGAVLPGSVASRFGNRKPPSAAYATQSPVMYYDGEDDTYVGGNFWDGRATGARLGSPSAEQALAPFLNPVEQALPDAACVLFRVSRATYRGLFLAAWGQDVAVSTWPAGTEAACRTEGATVVLTPAQRAAVMADYDRVGFAIAAFENSSTVNRFSSKYDAYQAGHATLTTLEKQGLELFNGQAGCAGCHPSDGPNALFTDYTYDNIGVPPNPDNPALHANGTFSDLGLGGFLHDPSRDGAQKVPTLRNIDLRPRADARKAYMHNGVFKSLEQVVHFYNTRDVLPDCAATASPKFGVNCWPAPEIGRNVNRDELGNLGLTAAQEAAVVAYLKTLSDGYR